MSLFERHETDVLFTLMAARYEMRSLLITSGCLLKMEFHL